MTILRSNIGSLRNHKMTKKILPLALATIFLFSESRSETLNYVPFDGSRHSVGQAPATGGVDGIGYYNNFLGEPVIVSAGGGDKKMRFDNSAEDQAAFFDYSLTGVDHAIVSADVTALSVTESVFMIYFGDFTDIANPDFYRLIVAPSGLFYAGPDGNLVTIDNTFALSPSIPTRFEMVWDGISKTIRISVDGALVHTQSDPILGICTSVAISLLDLDDSNGIAPSGIVDVDEVVVATPGTIPDVKSGRSKTSIPEDVRFTLYTTRMNQQKIYYRTRNRDIFATDTYRYKSQPGDSKFNVYYYQRRSGITEQVTGKVLTNRLMHTVGADQQGYIVEMRVKPKISIRHTGGKKTFTMRVDSTASRAASTHMDSVQGRIEVTR